MNKNNEILFITKNRLINRFSAYFCFRNYERNLKYKNFEMLLRCKV